MACGIWMHMAVGHVQPQSKGSRKKQGGRFTGWWYTYPSEKYEFVSWYDDILTFPTEWKVIKFHGASHHQPIYVCLTSC